MITLHVKDFFLFESHKFLQLDNICAFFIDRIFTDLLSEFLF